MRLLVLDGNSIINRAFYGIKLLTTKDGRYTNGLYGFLLILHKLKEELKPDGIAAAFDLHAPTFRHKEYAEYKAGRKGMPDELRQQMPVLKEMLTLMGCHVLEHEGYEADDILGTLAASAGEKGWECVIATGDRDSLQLVREGVSVMLACTKLGKPETIVYDTAAINEKYGLAPQQLIELKALMGDASDNIPGVPGVGEKTGLELVRRYGSLENIYNDLDSLDIKAGVREKLRAGRDSAFLSRKLGTICCEVPIERDLDTYKLEQMKAPELSAMLARLEFFSWIEKLGLDLAVQTPLGEQPVSDRVVTVEGGEALPELLEWTDKNKQLDMTAQVENLKLNAVAVSFGGRSAVISAQTDGFDELKKRICDGNINKRVADTKTLCAALLNEGMQPGGIVMDTMLAGYLLNPLSSDYSIGRLAQEYGVAAPRVEGGDGGVSLLPAVADRLEGELTAHGQEALLRDVEIPLANVLADMENNGFEVDIQGITEFGDMLGKRIDDLQREITTAVGYEFNLNSPKQLSKALFEDLGLPAKKKTKTGYSTNAEVLESLRNAHPAVAMLLDYRTLTKLKSTYCDGLLKVVGDDGRIHTSFNQTETRTGRISSTEPNLQNIPVRQELGRELRRFFRAQEGWTLCDADYSQIELRVLAHMAEDKDMISAFNKGTDIHSVTASQVFDVPEEMVTPLMRSRAKAVNFGIVYGIGAHSLSEDIGVSYGEAKRYIEQYLEHYSGVAKFMDSMIELARERGYAQTLFARRRPLPELKATNAVMRSFGERVARNTPIQGTAADIIKIAMVRVYNRLKKEGMKARLILQVHDELIVEAPLEEAEKAAALLKEEMESAADMAVKLAADVQIGRTWYDAKG
ncbi:MAG: DNA polymerase I [Oscillospiraceae bacterium]|nr:DNA polymerase I [Oscillospiraceae bacterium]MDD3833599.1 DNA polymerase I [Oscillospiraceae bacterium]